MKINRLNFQEYQNGGLLEHFEKLFLIFFLYYNCNTEFTYIAWKPFHCLMTTILQSNSKTYSSGGHAFPFKFLFSQE